jgi:UDP-galactopyranose mutase
MPLDDFQGTSIMNYVDREIPYTRIIEPRHFYPERTGTYRGTVVIREYPCDNPDEPYYPTRMKQDKGILAKYQKLQRYEKNVVFGGRLAEYKYYNMDQVISRALQQVKKHQTGKSSEETL